jgi:hypothetical protein
MNLPNQCLVPSFSNCAIYELEGVDFNVAISNKGKGIEADSAKFFIGATNKWHSAQPYAQIVAGISFYRVSCYMVNDRGELMEATILKRYDSWDKAAWEMKGVCDLLNR